MELDRVLAQPQVLAYRLGRATVGDSTQDRGLARRELRPGGNRSSSTPSSLCRRRLASVGFEAATGAGGPHDVRDGFGDEPGPPGPRVGQGERSSEAEITTALISGQRSFSSATQSIP